MSVPESWQSLVSVILAHPVRPQIIVCQEDGGWVLPQVQIAQKWVTPISAINAEMQRRFGLQTTVLRIVDNCEDESAQRVYTIHLLELHQPAHELPTGLRWLEINEVETLIFAHPQQHAAVVACLGESQAEITPPLRVPWAQPGWQANTEQWIHSQLTQLGYRLTGPIEQIKIWFLSCVLRAPTDRGQVYFKVTNATPLMVNEAIVTQALAQMFPAYLPKTVAIEPAQGWMLLADFGKTVGWEAPLDLRATVLSDFARLQIASASKIDQLLAVGCIDRRLPQLADQIDRLFADAEMIAYVTPEIEQRLLAAAPRLKALCRELDQYQVPYTLVHGDLNMGNIAYQAEPNGTPETAQSIFFDWTDACVAHPFFDMIEILFERDAAIQTQLCDRYLAMWLAYEPLDRLLEMWQIAYPLCALHQAVSYQHIILTNERADCKQEMAWAMPFWFGKILESLSQGDAHAR